MHARRTLATFENAYQVAIQRLECEDRPMFIVDTGNAAQPYRVCERPKSSETILARMCLQPSMENLGSV